MATNDYESEYDTDADRIVAALDRLTLAVMGIGADIHAHVNDGVCSGGVDWWKTLRRDST